MGYKVLARKWRPQIFADIVGQEHVLATLVNGLSLGRIHHAYLFSGTRGVGKTTIARLLAKGLNCETGITAIPCRQCSNCLALEQGGFIDLIEIDAASRTRVEDIRDLLDYTQYMPSRGRFKVYLIDEVHMLSRHSFNALLKTLEEPPKHVKFLLATTDPQKLPITILSRCLKCHLKALEITQILHQLQIVMNAEQITSDARALQLLARAANGSMRDALTLTDQAIALGQGQVTAINVCNMLGLLDYNQPLTILEALINADSEKVMAQVAEVASQGVEWENLLVEMLALLHRLAMLQLLPEIIDTQHDDIEQRLRKLTRIIPPTDVQLYYQILLVGRKELSYAPDRRMGVEMTLLRALVFHPKTGAHKLQVSPIQPTQPIRVQQSQDMLIPLDSVVVSQNDPQPELLDTTTQLLQARNQLLQQGKITAKKCEPEVLQQALLVNSSLKRLASVTERIKKHQAEKIPSSKPVKEEPYHRHTLSSSKVAPEVLMPLKASCTIRTHEKIPILLAKKLLIELLERDSWSAEIAKLKLPKLVQQLALNTFKQQEEAGNICLHLRSTKYHLNSRAAQRILADALSKLYGHEVALRVVVDDNPEERTPAEWRQAIYKEKLSQAQQSMIADKHVQMLCSFFDAELDKDSIRPI